MLNNVVAKLILGVVFTACLIGSNGAFGMSKELRKEIKENKYAKYHRLPRIFSMPSPNGNAVPFTTYHIIGNHNPKFNGTFWEHDYIKNNTTHTGIDYDIGNNDKHVSVLSYGFGKAVDVREPAPDPETQKTGTNAVNIRNLLNNGQYVRFNLFHFQQDSITVNTGDYIAKYQILGREGNTGLGFGISNPDPKTHLHLEVANLPQDGNFTTPLVDDDLACPGDGCKDENRRTTQYDMGNTIAHYEVESKTSPNIPNRGLVWYDPSLIVSNYNELIPFLSKTNSSPSESNYDVYGIANKTIKGFLGAKGSFGRTGILVRRSNNRNDANNPSTSASHKFLAELRNSFTQGFTGSYSGYETDEYLFLGYVEENAKGRYGYPIRFDFLQNENSVIVDNDQRNSGNYQYSHNINGETNSVPGYYLTAKLVKGTIDARADWKPGKSGKYNIFVHIPDGAEAVNLTYRIWPNGFGNGSPIFSNKVNQSGNNNKWVLIKSGVDFGSDGVVSLNIKPNSNAEFNSHAVNTWVAFDAVKFEFVGENEEVSDLLVADFSASPTEVPLVVEFKDETSGGKKPYKYSWDFDDGSSLSPEQNATHTFSSRLKPYNVALTVTDNSAPSQKSIKERPILVNDEPSEPVITSLTVTPLTAKRFSLETATVTALDQNNQPMSGIKVAASGNSGAFIFPQSKTTGSDGKAEFLFMFIFESGGFFSKNGGKITFAADSKTAIITQPSTTFSASGRVTKSDGTGIPDVTMSFTRVSGTGSAPPSAQADINGNWNKSGFQTETTYRVTPSKPGYTFSPTSRDFSSENAGLNFTGTPPLTDDNFPSVSITSPDNGDIVSDTVNVTAKVTDGNGITKVEFYLDGTLKFTDTSSPYSWSWDTTLSTNGSYLLKAIAYDTINQTATNQINVTVRNTDEIPPESFSVNAFAECSGSSSAIRLTWSVFLNATSFDIFRNGFSVVSGLVTSDGLYVDTSVIAGTTYTYIVRAHNDAGSTDSSSVTIAAPTNCLFTLTAEPECSGTVSQIHLTWSVPPGVIGTVDIYRDGSIILSDFRFTEFTDTGVLPGTNYTYFLRVVTIDGTRDSTSALVTALNCGTSPPGDFSLTATPECSEGNPQIRLTWTASSGVDFYQVIRDGQTLDGVSSTTSTYLDQDVVDGTTYTYEVKALNGGGETVSLATVTAECGTIPGIFTLTVNPLCVESDSVNIVSWTGAAGRVPPEEIFRDGVLVFTTSAGQYDDLDVIPGETYTYFVRAKNSAGQRDSNAVTVLTKSDCGAPVAPVITSITPQMVTIGDGAFTFTVTGSNFEQLAKIVRGDAGQDPSTFTASVTPVFINSSTLQVNIDQTSNGFSFPFTSPGTFEILVVNVTGPNLQGERSNTVPFTIFNPIPKISSISGTCSAGSNCGISNGFDVKINGSGFVRNSAFINGQFFSSSTLELNGQQLSPDTLGQGPVYSQMQLGVNGTLIPTPGSYEIKICNAGTTDGTSCTTATLTVTP
ncbi:MAG: Ig-like domain-containing protein [Candidatus Anammoxibacter sp.]